MKRLVIVIFIIFASFLTFSLYRTFAYDTSVVEETPSTTDLEYTFKIGNSSIKQITVDSGETKYYDVVLGNPNLAKISYGVYYEMVSPSRNLDGFSIEYTSKSTGASTGKVDKEGNITLNLVVTNTSSSSVTVKLGTVAGYVNGGELTLNNGQEYIPEKVLTASEYIMSLNDGTNGDSGSGVYKVHHEAIPANSSATGEIIEATDDYRYYGKSPNNYICLDKNSDNTCEDRHLYRIIGSMREDSDNIYKLKVIKATPLTDGTNNQFSWDCDNGNLIITSQLMSNIIPLAGSNNVCNSSDNAWNDATIMKLLNYIWYNNSASIYDNNYDSGPINVDFANYGMNSKAKKLINTSSSFNIGTYSKNDFTSTFDNKYYDSKKINWIGTTALINISDYAYATGNNCVTKILINQFANKCNNYNWINNDNWEWSLDIDSDDSYRVWVYGPGSTDGRVMGNNAVDLTYSLRPTFYLKPEVVITGGTGEETSPYTVSIE